MNAVKTEEEELNHLSNNFDVKMEDKQSGDMCRVCRSEGTDDKPLYYPCVCTGSIKYIHQDCLVQWLRYSKKEYCELCKHRYTFTPIYAPDMPKRLPIRDIVMGLVRGIATAVRFWFHYTLVAVAWLGIVPLTACRIYRCLFTGSINALLTLPLDLLSTENLAADCFQGCFVVTCTLCTFISLVWLREQILHGGGPDWLDRDVAPANNRANRAENAPVNRAAAPVAAPAAENIAVPEANPPVDQAPDAAVEAVPLAAPAVPAAAPAVPAGDAAVPIAAPAMLVADAMAEAAVPAAVPAAMAEDQAAVAAEEAGAAAADVAAEVIDDNADTDDDDVDDEDDDEDDDEGENNHAGGIAADINNWIPNDWDRAAEELTWERLLGLDGSLLFLEHVFWVVSLNTLFILVFAFCPYHIGRLLVLWFNFHTTISVTQFEGVLTAMVGYLFIALTLITLHFMGSLARFKTACRVFGLCYVAVKVSLLVIVEIGLFPLICGWWLDICSLNMFDATLKDRENNFRLAPATSMFIHWLIGMVYIFYFASFILLLREVLRPGLLWFLRNINDPDFNPIQEMIHLSIYRHIRRFVASMVVFGTIILIMLWLPVQVVRKLFPSFFPFHIMLSGDTPVSELSLELLLLQVVLPAMLEQGHMRQWLRGLIRGWCRLAAWLLDLRSYLLGDEPATQEPAPPQNEDPARNEEAVNENAAADAAVQIANPMNTAAAGENAQAAEDDKIYLSAVQPQLSATMASLYPEDEDTAELQLVENLSYENRSMFDRMRSNGQTLDKQKFFSDGSSVDALLDYNDDNDNDDCNYNDDLVGLDSINLENKFALSGDIIGQNLEKLEPLSDGLGNVGHLAVSPEAFNRPGGASSLQDYGLLEDDRHGKAGTLDHIQSLHLSSDLSQSNLEPKRAFEVSPAPRVPPLELHISPLAAPPLQPAAAAPPLEQALAAPNQLPAAPGIQQPAAALAHPMNQPAALAPPLNQPAVAAPANQPAAANNVAQAADAAVNQPQQQQQQPAMNLGLGNAHQAFLQAGVPMGYQPYRAPDLFAVRVVCLVLFMCVTLFLASLLSFTLPVFVGRRLMRLWTGEVRIHELYTAACGLYFCWIALRVASVVYTWIPQGWAAISLKIREWIVLVGKSLLIAVIMIGVVPLMLGLWFELVFVIPFRVPLDQSPMYFPWQDWALGVLHAKIIIATTMMGPQWRLKAVIEQIYNRGLRQMDLKFVLKELCLPFVVTLGLMLAVPFVVSKSIVPAIGFDIETENLVYRRVYPCLLAAVLCVAFVIFQARQFRRLYEHIRNDKYLVGQRLVNYERKAASAAAS